jgi:hypothetical protein
MTLLAYPSLPLKRVSHQCAQDLSCSVPSWSIQTNARMPPPSLLHGLSCVVHSASQIAYHAARIRASQVGLNAAGPSSALVKQTREKRDQQRREEDEEADRAIRRPKRILHTRPAEVLKPMVSEVILPAAPAPAPAPAPVSPEPSLAHLTSSGSSREREITPQLAVESSSEPLEVTALHPEPILKDPHRTSTTLPSSLSFPLKQVRPSLEPRGGITELVTGHRT